MGMLPKEARGQGGYTLVEVVITAAIGAVVMGALTSVILTAVRATETASSRVEASSQIRNFEVFAYGDFAGNQVQNGSSCTKLAPCTTQPIVLTGMQASNSDPPVLAASTVTYTWDGSTFLDRQVSGGGPASHTATDVTAFAWYVDTSAAFPSVVVQLTVTVKAYAQSQTFLFYPRVNP